MTQLGFSPEIRFCPSRPWMELILPLYALGLILLYYQPWVLTPILDNVPMNAIVWWALWIIIGALGGLLALSALFLAFCLLYSPLYLVSNARRILDPGTWIDHREVRFFFGCFVLLCGLITPALLDPTAALVSFTVLAGFAHIVLRFLV